jgi:hypothetical protein
MDRVEELNARISSRMKPSSAPHVVFSPRPASTKHMLFPLVDAVPPSTVPITSRPPVSFLPGNYAPFSGFDVDSDSELRNIKYAIQSDVRATYVPSSKSDLYVVKIPKEPSVQTHPHLFMHVVSEKPLLRVKEQLFNNVRLR